MSERLTPYVFRRYVNGREMAEGVAIHHAENLEHAIRKATALCRGERGTVLVLEEEAGRAALTSPA